ncbi:cytoskeleton-associated protein 2-like isoform X2 [Chiloscyllium plagiosum]|uniref:cytoskeleton-associated protein 2-like isoform X2 n=1 Tax=Chiloscyllium plagiosum TaxID=36176 RepID=UPI001CB7C36D|nr:cytoskeleton-associated protein 2-like isoform X2 [Chiloscyllium plagiosum]XP_043548078.1 cytoskeleton-associated protein 2-like isoform X2 [Chiloscyllium plagiosum]
MNTFKCKKTHQVYLRDKTNIEKLQASTWQTEGMVFGGKKIESKKSIQNKPVQNRTINQLPTQSESTLLKRESPFVNNNSATSETGMPSQQITQPEEHLLAAQENNLEVEQKLKGNITVAVNKSKTAQSTDSKMLHFGQKYNSNVEQKSKLKSHPKVQKVTLSQSFLAVKNEQAKLMIDEKNNQSKLPNTIKKPILGSFRGKIVESKIQSFRSGTLQKERKQEKTDLLTHTSTEMHNIESKGIMHKPRPKGVENRHPVRRAMNVTSHSKQKSLTAATGLLTASSQKPLVTDVLDLKLDFAQSGCDDTAVVATPTIRAKKTTVPIQHTSNSVSARHPSWNFSKAVGNLKPLKQKVPIEGKSGAQLTQSIASKGNLVKRPTMTSLQRKKVVESHWTAIVEEENRSELVEKVNQTLSQYLKQINEGCPSEDCLQSLQTLIESVPKAKKFARYWICLAQLEQRKGSVHNVMAIYEQAIKIGAQPADELRITLVDILKNTKTPKKQHVAMNKTEDGAQKDPKLELVCVTEQSVSKRSKVDLADTEQRPSIEKSAECMNDKPDLPPENHEMRIAATDDHNVSRENEGDLLFTEQQVSCNGKADLSAGEQQLYAREEVEPTSKELHSPSMERVVDEADGKEDCEVEDVTVDHMKTPLKQILTPSKTQNRGSSIKYSVSVTPRNKCDKNVVQMENRNSAIKELNFLTPVRRSRRIEQASSQMPLMLQDHNPCVSSLEDLKSLGGVSIAYSFKMNNALQH